jgi:methionyl-tRNA synthetase
LANRPEKSDTIFTWADFAVKNNNELLPNIGNLCNRSLKFIYSKYDQVIITINHYNQKMNSIIKYISIYYLFISENSSF